MRFVRRSVAPLLGVVAIAAGSLPVSMPAPAVAADAPWTLPTSPPRCADEKIATGDVAGCIITLGPGLPEDRGWPAPPFPEPQGTTTTTWVNLAIGSTGPTVAKVQAALNAAGASLSTDGLFGSLTDAAVRTYQQANGLAVTGVVDAAMAALLGVQNTTGGTFPPSGWTWLGWGYNASTALAAWEKGFSANTRPIGSMRVGQLRAFPEALALFEGFYSEIQAKGYVIRDGGTYVFRCTASTRKDCAGLTRSALSNHAYGLATDINTAKNPMRRYYGVNGATACATPVVTDLPRWVIQTAEKWGLYWGGYGWSSGCSSPTQWRTSVSRDPMHFEFNGTPAQARAILRHNVGSGACLDLVSEMGVDGAWCLMKKEVPGPGTRIAVATTPPAGATAALVNVVTTGVLRGGVVTAEDCGPRSGGRPTITAIARAGRSVATNAIVPLDADGRFCLYQTGTFHTVVDLQGFFVPSASAPDGALFTPIAGVRPVDTRSTTWCEPDGSCNAPSTVPPLAESMVTVPTAITPTAAVVNLTVVRPAASGYLSADTCDALAPPAFTHANINFSSLDSAITNMGVVPVTSTDLGAQFCSFSTTTSHEVVDVNGWFAPAAQGGLGFTPLPSRPVLDTRQCRVDPLTSATTCGTMSPAGGTIRVKAPDGAAAVAITTTSILPTAGGYLAPAACSTFDAGGQVTPSVQAVVGWWAVNLALVPVDPDGTFCLRTASPMHVKVDLWGVFAPDADGRFVTVTQSRLLDTRLPG